MSGLPDFLDLPSIQAQLRELGHDVSLEKVEGLLVELGFAGSQGELALPPAAAADIPEAAEADAAAPHSLDGLLPQMAHLQVRRRWDTAPALAGGHARQRPSAGRAPHRRWRTQLTSPALRLVKRSRLHSSGAAGGTLSSQHCAHCCRPAVALRPLS